MTQHAATEANGRREERAEADRVRTVKGGTGKEVEIGIDARSFVSQMPEGLYSACCQNLILNRHP